MPEDGQTGLESNGTEASNATRVGPAGWPSGSGAGTARPAAGHQRDRVPQMLTRAELYDLLGYSGYEERDRSYFG